MTLALNLKTKLLWLLILCTSSISYANPTTNNEPSPSAVFVTDLEILSKLELDEPGVPVWCYNNLSNSILISSGYTEREKCQLACRQDITRIKVGHSFEIDQLKIQIESLTQEHEEVLKIKNNQIEDLTRAAMEVPNDNSIWWATGGFTVGALGVLAIFFAVN